MCLRLPAGPRFREFSDRIAHRLRRLRELAGCADLAPELRQPDADCLDFSTIAWLNDAAVGEAVSRVGWQRGERQFRQPVVDGAQQSEQCLQPFWQLVDCGCDSQRHFARRSRCRGRGGICLVKRLFVVADHELSFSGVYLFNGLPYLNGK